MKSSMFWGYLGHLPAYTLLKSINTKNDIITYTHPVCTFNKKPPLKMGIQGPNLYIFL